MCPTHCIPYCLHVGILDPRGVVFLTLTRESQCTETRLCTIFVVFSLINHEHAKNSQEIRADYCFLSPFFIMVPFLSIFCSSLKIGRCIRTGSMK